MGGDVSRPLVRKTRPVEQVVDAVPEVVRDELVMDTTFAEREGQLIREQMAVDGARPRRGRAPEKRASYLPDNYRTMPQSMDAEKGVLCSCLLSPSLIGPTFDVVPTEAFYHPAHRTIAELMVELHDTAGVQLDFIVLTQELHDRGTLDKVGGAAAISELFTFVPTASNADYYIDIVREKWHLRKLIQQCADFMARAYETETEAKFLLDEFETAAKELGVEVVGERDRTQEISFRDLMQFDAKHDPNAILGHRWLCRGGSGLWVGQSGIGKSSIAMQAGLAWGQGQALWGVKPTGGRRLKSLYIQAENDEGDMAEMCQGVLRSTPRPPGMTEEQFLREMSAQMVFVRDAVHSGVDFARSASRLIAKHKPDLVWVDPLLSYVGDDISTQKVASNFLRNTLNPIAFDTGIVWMLLHHTGKPSTDPKARAHWTDHDFAYQAFGSSELVNWARAVNVLRGLPSGMFELRFGKRGKRSGLTMYDGDLVDLDQALEGMGPDVGAKDQRGEYTDVIYLKHAEKGIYWEQIEAPTEEQLAQASKKRSAGKFDTKFTVDTVLDLLRGVENNGRKAKEVCQLCYDEAGMSRAAFYRLWPEVKKSASVVFRDGRVYLVGES